MRLREGSLLSKTGDSKTSDIITDSLWEVQLCKGISKIIGEGVNICTSERSWIHYEQDAPSKLV